ncbi:hypothetical protein GOP47_0006488 [Adiantum capillus-veneris]|uniref:Uncharacterized protein n=1 Tax=Adiantum capillus-veneris TaxID=13818 RepID=A0A9D4ZM35_ADICA|nr:hypothetical protein GOP47_0006488 [Adiantum capillus-veneris]
MVTTYERAPTHEIRTFGATLPWAKSAVLVSTPRCSIYRTHAMESLVHSSLSPLPHRRLALQNSFLRHSAMACALPSYSLLQ